MMRADVRLVSMNIDVEDSLFHRRTEGGKMAALDDIGLAFLNGKLKQPKRHLPAIKPNVFKITMKYFFNCVSVDKDSLFQGDEKLSSCVCGDPAMYLSQTMNFS